MTIEKSEDSGSSCSASSKDSFAKWLVSGLVSTPPFLLSLFFKFFRQALHFISSLYLISFDMIDYFFLQTHCFVGFCETPFPLSFYYSNCTFSLYFHFAYWSSLEELCTSILAFSLSRCRTAERTRHGWDGAGWDVCGHMCFDSSKHS